MFDVVISRDEAARLHAAVDALTKRVQDLESRPKPKTKDRWDKLQILAGASLPLIVAILAFLLTGRIEVALKERTLEVSTVKEMQALILKIVNSETIEESTGAAVGLAAYGRSAVPPLLDLLRSPNYIVVAGAAEGLRTIAARDPDPVCRAVTAIPANHTGLYTWENHKFAIDLVGQIRCRNGRNVVSSYGQLVAGGVDKVKAVTAPYPPVTADSIEQLQSSIAAAEQRLR